MSIDFSAERWAKVKEDSRLWWAGKLKRPLLQMTTTGRDPGRPEPTTPTPNRGITSYNLKYSPEAIVDRWDYELEIREFLGDAFPNLWVDFGAGVVAAFMGALADPALDTVWFHPAQEREVTELDFRFDSENPIVRRIADIYRIGMQRWNGQVQMGMTDLGGNLDILSTFRPSEKLLLDLYDHPDHVKRLTWQAHDIWWKYFNQFNQILQPTKKGFNPGYTAWTSIFSEEPYYMLQCDFCYMIGPDMFDEFVKPELEATCKKLKNAFYHLDGPGELAHLDSLLSIKELKGVQWVPGAGQRDVDEWPEVYQKIRAAGKLIQTFASMKTFDSLVEKLGSAEGMVNILPVKPSQRGEAEAFLRKYGAM